MTDDGPSDIEMAHIKRVCTKLASSIDGVTPQVALCAVEVFIATLLVETGVPVAELMDGVRETVERMQWVRT